MPKVFRKIFTEETEEELMAMTRDEVTDQLTDKQRLFCEAFVKNYNIRIAAIKAGYNKNTPHVIGWKLRQNPDINRYIAWLKLLVANKFFIGATDIIDQYVRIAFADITDFAKIEKGKLRIIDGSEIDGQLVSEIKSGKDGVTIKLVDKLKALEKLEHYFDVMPKDWRQKIEERKVEIMQQRLELDKVRAGQGEEELADDGFIEALKSSAQQVWEDEVK